MTKRWLTVAAAAMLAIAPVGCAGDEGGGGGDLIEPGTNPGAMNDDLDAEDNEPKSGGLDPGVEEHSEDTNTTE